MKIGLQSICTPDEDPVFYDLAWRHRVASAVVEAGPKQGLPPALRQDRCIRDWVAYMRNSRGITKDARDARERVCSWRDNTRLPTILNPLLLTGVDYATIAEDLPGLSPDLLRLYEQSFFNVRTEDGEMRPIHLLRIRFGEELQNANDMPAMLMKAALTGGYGLIKGLWSDRRPTDNNSTVDMVETTQALIEQELTRRVLQGRMDTKDLLRMRQVQNETKRLQHDIRAGGQGAEDAWGLVRDMLALARPKLAEAVSVDQRLACEATKNRYAAENEISKQAVEDRGLGAGIDEMNERLRNRLSAERRA